MSVSVFIRAANRARIVLQGRISCFRLAVSLVEGKSGLEIGGGERIFESGIALCQFTEKRVL
jgi:hypothetical protein